MSPTWRSDEPRPRRITPAGWLRIAIRGPILFVIVFGGLLLMLLLRQIERPIHGLHRPWTPHITLAVCRASLRIIGLPCRVSGAPMKHPGAVVANHSSWLDIFVLNAIQRVYFVSKDEVAGWPGIGWLARATGTVFIERVARAARAQRELFEARLGAGHKLLFFPEGTSSDGRRVLPFKSTLFAAFFSDHLKDIAWIQAVTVRYTAPSGADPRFYGWWGDMDFGPHLLQILAAAPQGSVDVVLQPPARVADFADRKALAAATEAEVRNIFEAGPSSPQNSSGVSGG